MEPRRVLVVEDDEPARRMLWSLLFLDGYDVEWAERGEEAVRRAEVLRPDAILLDIMLPDMDGHEVARALRADPALARVPIIFLTARRDPDERVWCEEEGGFALVRKPFICGELMDTVRRALDAARPVA